MGYMGLLLGGCIYLLRVDFSMAMVCMVKPPETISHNSSNTSLVFQYGKYLQPLEDNSTSPSPITYPLEENRTVMSLVDIECRNGVQKDGVDQQVGTKHIQEHSNSSHYFHQFSLLHLLHCLSAV